MKWLTELKSVRTTNVSFLSSLWKAISVAGTGLDRGHAIECECKADVLPWRKIVLIAVRRDRGDNHLRARHIRNSISLTIFGPHRIICASFRTVRNRSTSI
jgi:hypothetical protein